MDEQAIATKRKPGRPRKTPSAPLALAVGSGAASCKRVLHASNVRMEKLSGCSNSTLERLVKYDVDFPAPFALHGRYERYWLEADIDEYLVLKAKRAQEAKEARLAQRQQEQAREAAAREAARAQAEVATPKAREPRSMAPAKPKGKRAAKDTNKRTPKHTTPPEAEAV
jgi:predicted DNA-binding transcriptional regulator AlpA